MPIQGRMTRERERIMGMTPEERKWRGKYYPYRGGSSYYIMFKTKIAFIFQRNT